LLDIIMIVPSIRRARSSQSSPVDVVLALEKLLRSLFRRESETVACMRRRLSEVDFGPVSLVGVELGLGLLRDTDTDRGMSVEGAGDSEDERQGDDEGQGVVWWDSQSLGLELGLDLGEGFIEQGIIEGEGESEGQAGWYEL
jgi:hypothetical protein